MSEWFTRANGKTYHVNAKGYGDDRLNIQQIEDGRFKIYMDGEQNAPPLIDNLPTLDAAKTAYLLLRTTGEYKR